MRISRPLFSGIVLGVCAGFPVGVAAQPSGRALSKSGVPVRAQELLALDLNGTPIGEIPVGLKLLRGNIEVAIKDGAPMLKASAPSEFLITLSEPLPHDFTLEFDLIAKAGGPPPDLTIEGTPTINQGPASAHLLWQADAYLAVIGGAQDNYEQPMPDDLRAALPGVLAHIGVSVEGTALKLYTNGRRLYTLERQFARGQVLRVSLGGVSETNAVYLAGLRIAGGAVATVAEDSRRNTESESKASTGSLTPSLVAGVTVTQGTAGPVVAWSPLSNATSYTVKRWKTDDAACCNRTSPTLSGPPWQDQPLSVAGTYVFEVAATTPEGIATGQTQFVHFKAGGQIATAAPTGASAAGAVTAVALPAVQTGTITPLAPTPPPPPSPLERPTLSGMPAVLSNGPAPTGLAVTGTPGVATVTWTAVPGATGYLVERGLSGTTSWTSLTASQIAETRLANDPLPDFAATYTYRVRAYQADGRFGSATVDFTGAPPSDPTQLLGELVRPAGVRLSWVAVPGATEYVVSGPGFPSDARTSATSISVMTAPPGLNAYRVASVFPPGRVLTAESAWPSATVKVPPIPSVAFLSLPNGTGSLAEYNRHACGAGKWVAAELVWPNDWCSVPGPNSVARVELKPLLDLFGIKLWAEWEGPLDPTSWSTYSERPWAMLEQRVTGQSAFESIWWEPKFIDEVDLARQRRVGCTTRGTAPNTSMLCWAVSTKPGELPPGGGPEERRGTVSILIQEPSGTHFLSFKEVEDAASPSGWKLVGSPTAELDSQGERYLPHVCLACHGGRINPETGKVTGASALPLDPAGFTGLPGEAVNGGQNSAAMYRVHQAILKAPLAPGVQEYINQMYVSNPGSTPYISLSVIPPGWSAQPEIYAKIIRPYCARCHSVQSGPLGFRSWADVVMEKVRIRQSVCTGRMPHSETAFHKFWSDGGAVSLPGWLLGALGYAGCP